MYVEGQRNWHLRKKTKFRHVSPPLCFTFPGIWMNTDKAQSLSRSLMLFIRPILSCGVETFPSLSTQCSIIFYFYLAVIALHSAWLPINGSFSLEVCLISTRLAFVNREARLPHGLFGSKDFLPWSWVVTQYRCKSIEGPTIRISSEKWCRMVHLIVGELSRSQFYVLFAG